MRFGSLAVGFFPAASCWNSEFNCGVFPSAANCQRLATFACPSAKLFSWLALYAARPAVSAFFIFWYGTLAGIRPRDLLRIYWHSRFKISNEPLDPTIYTFGASFGLELFLFF